MAEFFIENWGVSPQFFSYVILPLLIFFARVCDVSLSTIRIMFVMIRKRKLAPILGFFEAFIWLLAIGQIISDVDNILAFLGYALGFAAGTYVGMYFEEKLAVGMAVLRLISPTISNKLIDFLHEHNFRYSLITGKGRMGKVKILFLVVKRDHLEQLIEGINAHHPNAFYTIEGVQQINESHQFSSPILKNNTYRWWQMKWR